MSSGEAPFAAASDTAAPVEVTPGQATTIQAAPVQTAPDTNPAAEAARTAVVGALRDRSAVLFDDDRRLKLDPMLKAAGVSIRRSSAAAGSGRR